MLFPLSLLFLVFYSIKQMLTFKAQYSTFASLRLLFSFHLITFLLFSPSLPSSFLISYSLYPHLPSPLFSSHIHFSSFSPLLFPLSLSPPRRPTSANGSAAAGTGRSGHTGWGDERKERRKQWFNENNKANKAKINRKRREIMKKRVLVRERREE